MKLFHSKNAPKLNDFLKETVGTLTFVGEDERKPAASNDAKPSAKCSNAKPAAKCSDVVDSLKDAKPAVKHSDAEDDSNIVAIFAGMRTAAAAAKAEVDDVSGAAAAAVSTYPTSDPFPSTKTSQAFAFTPKANTSKAKASFAANAPTNMRSKSPACVGGQDRLAKLEQDRLARIEFARIDQFVATFANNKRNELIAKCCMTNYSFCGDDSVAQSVKPKKQAIECVDMSKLDEESSSDEEDNNDSDYIESD